MFASQTFHCECSFVNTLPSHQWKLSIVTCFRHNNIFIFLVWDVAYSRIVNIANPMFVKHLMNPIIQLTRRSSKSKYTWYERIQANWIESFYAEQNKFWQNALSSVMSGSSKEIGKLNIILVLLVGNFILEKPEYCFYTICVFILWSDDSGQWHNQLCGLKLATLTSINLLSPGTLIYTFNADISSGVESRYISLNVSSSGSSS